MSAHRRYRADLLSLAQEIGGLKADQARRMKYLEEENLWLRRAILDDDGTSAALVKTQRTAKQFCRSFIRGSAIIGKRISNLC
jgi:hypothetical protein